MNHLGVHGGNEDYFRNMPCDQCPLKQMLQSGQALDASQIGPVLPNSITIVNIEAHFGDETHIEYKGNPIMEQTNQNYGNAGVVGNAENNQGTIAGQIGSSVSSESSLLEQLSYLRTSLKPEPTEVDHAIAIGKIAEAEQAVQEGQEPTPLSRLSEKGAKWVLSFAESVGAKLVVEYIKHSFGWK